MSKIFSSIKLNGVELKNRLAVAPMTTSQSNPDGSLSAEEEAWLKRLAQDGYGMVITCATTISDNATAFPNQLSFAKDEFVPQLSALAKQMKSYNSVNIVQLCHAGSRAINTEAYSASSYEMPEIPGFVPPKTLSEKQINQIIADFAETSQRAEKAGFDGIELHGANGYLFTQFISTMTNLREDSYGGSLENRAKFSRQVVQACRKAVSPGFIIGFRMSFENSGLEKGLDIDENIQISNWLAEDGADYIHISSLDFQSKSIKYPDENALQYIRSGITSNIALIGVGGITSLAEAEQVMEYGADLVAIGRASIGNKNLPKVFASGKNLPATMPFEENYLSDLGISRDFMNYFKKMPVVMLNILKTN